MAEQSTLPAHLVTDDQGSPSRRRFQLVAGGATGAEARAAWPRTPRTRQVGRSSRDPRAHHRLGRLWIRSDVPARGEAATRSTSGVLDSLGIRPPAPEGRDAEADGVTGCGTVRCVDPADCRPRRGSSTDPSAVAPRPDPRLVGRAALHRTRVRRFLDSDPRRWATDLCLGVRPRRPGRVATPSRSLEHRRPGPEDPNGRLRRSAGGGGRGDGPGCPYRGPGRRPSLRPCFPTMPAREGSGERSTPDPDACDGDTRAAPLAAVPGDPLDRHVVSQRRLRAEPIGGATAPPWRNEAP